ncbi:MAG: glycosyltransferase family 2 protein [Candidatus Woesearchaeota archaeon]
MADMVQVILWIVYFVSLYFTLFWFVVFMENWEKLRPIKRRLNRFPFVTVVIPALNEEAHIENTTMSVLDLDYPKEKLQVIVVNDGSTDKTAQIVERLMITHKNLRLINQRNQGKAVALNKGLAAAKGEFFVCMDADSVVERDALKTMLPCFEDQRVGLVLPLMKAQQPKNLMQRMQFVEYIINIFLRKIMGFLDCIHVGPGPFSVYRKSVLQKLGGYEEGNITEDLEITLRLQKHGFRVVQVMDAIVYTETPSNLKAYYQQRNRWMKGGVINGLKYRDVMFNADYGDFGLIQLPVLVLSGLLALALLLTSTYQILNPVYSFVNKLKFVHFDILTFIMNLQTNFNPLDVRYLNAVIFATTLFFTLVMLHLAYKYTQEKMSSKNIPTVVIFIFIYFFILGIIWLGVVKDLVTGNKLGWEK